MLNQNFELKLHSRDPKMKTNVVMVCKKKLGCADAMLPLFFEIKDRYPRVRFFAFFPDAKTYELNRKNYDLWNGIQTLNPKVIVGGKKNKLKTIGFLLKFLLELALGRNIVIKIGDTIPQHIRFMHVLRKVSNTIEIKYYTSNLWPVHTINNIRAQYSIMRERKNPSTAEISPFAGDYDYFLSAISEEKFKRVLKLDTPSEKFVEMGFPRNFSQWKKYLTMSAGESRTVQRIPYFLYIMGTLGKRSQYLYEPSCSELFEETLRVLKKYNREIKGVFKPHAVTNIQMLEDILKKTGINNYTIDYGHAMVLATGAKFVISYNYSTTMIDAFYLGKPIIQYSDYDPRLLKMVGNWSMAGRCCDFFINRDVKKLEDTLNKLMYNKIELDRDPEFMKEAFPEVNLSFYKFLDKIFLSRDIL